MTRRWLIALLLLSGVLSAAQLRTGTVTGRLLSKDGTAAVGIRVSAIALEGRAWTRTGQDHSHL